MRGFVFILVALLALVPFVMSASVTQASVEARLAPAAGASALQYSHTDCTGPGLAGTAGPHATHTDRVSGFVIDPARPVNVNAVTSAIVSPGICPLGVSGPVLREFLTGSYHLVAVCRGTINDGATFVDFTIQSVAGRAVSSNFIGASCIGSPGAPFSLDVTITIGATNALPIALGPLGGVTTTAGQ